MKYVLEINRTWRSKKPLSLWEALNRKKEITRCFYSVRVVKLK